MGNISSDHQSQSGKKRAQKYNEKLIHSQKMMMWRDESEMQCATVQDTREDNVTDNIPKCNSMRKYLVNEYSPQRDESENDQGCLLDDTSKTILVS